MIMNIKQRKIQIAPKTKLNYNIDKGQSCFKIGGIGIHGIAVLGIFFADISAISILKCGIAVLFSPSVHGF